MTYTCIFDEGIILRDVDGVQVSPVEDSSNPDYLQYLSWVAAGNAPTEQQSRTELQRTKLLIKQRIKELRDHKTQNGGYQVNGKWYHSDVFSRSQHIGLVIMGANMPNNLLWKTMDGTFVTMTPQLAQQIFAAAAASAAALFARAEQLIAAVEQSSDPFLIDITNSWPPTFGGV